MCFKDRYQRAWRLSRVDIFRQREELFQWHNTSLCCRVALEIQHKPKPLSDQKTFHMAVCIKTDSLKLRRKDEAALVIV